MTQFYVGYGEVKTIKQPKNSDNFLCSLGWISARKMSLEGDFNEEHQKNSTNETGAARRFFAQVFFWSK